MHAEINISSLTSAIKERNRIEAQKLAFEKERFEYEKEVNNRSIMANEKNAEANEQLVGLISSFTNSMDAVCTRINQLIANQEFLNKELATIKFLVSDHKKGLLISED